MIFVGGRPGIATAFASYFPVADPTQTDCGGNRT